MKKFLYSFLLLSFVSTVVLAQTPTPDEFLGYPLGSKFTAHQKVVDYFKKVAATNKNIQLQSYGKTYEGRELLLAVVSDPENMSRLEQIRNDNLSLTKVEKTPQTNTKQPAILWLSYNVHGNEANSTETSMKVLYTLATANDKIKEWLKNTVVIIDPCLNPDGRERYVSYFNMVSGTTPNADPMAREHIEPWPGGRPNHYYFDLNRDWAWQTQIETQQRLAAYQKWMPQVHVDFHEQGYNEPYYFAPAAEPVHQNVTPWQRDFQVVVGKNNAKYFDAQGWQYFTKERFDLLYPSYGDTYPLYNGAIGMTYEQGGIRAGLAVITADGDTLTLKDRIAHHFTTSMATLETVSANASKLNAEFKKFFEQSNTTPQGSYKTYIVKAENTKKLRKMADLLVKNHISYAFGADRMLNGFNYETQKVENFKVERNDLIVNLQQPRSVLANVLFEPQTFVADSNTYDITAWALPYVYGLKAYAVKENVVGTYSVMDNKKEVLPLVAKPYAWAFEWNALEDAQALIALQKLNIKVRMAEQAFKTEEKTFPAGTLLVYRAENDRTNTNLMAVMDNVSKQKNCTFYPIASGLVTEGKDFGSSVYPLLVTPKVAVVAGTDISSQSVGEIWHLFEQELNYPITMINAQSIAALDLKKINVLLLPDGSYSEKLAEQLNPWLNAGGKLILIGDAIDGLVGKKPFDLKKKEPAKNEDKGDVDKKFVSKDNFQNAIPGAIYKVFLDQSHPLSFGLGKYYYSLKTDDKIYEPLTNGYSVGMLKDKSYLAGVAGDKVKAKLVSGMLFGTQSVGKGTVVYLTDDVLFREFWENGKQMFVNSLFLVY